MRRRFPVLLFLVLLLLDVVVFLLQKFASDHANVGGQAYFLRMATRPWVWISLAIAPLQLLVWTRILARAEISLAFPLTSLSVPLTMAAATWLLAERPTWHVWAGALLMAAGAVILKPAAAPTPESTENLVQLGQ